MGVFRAIADAVKDANEEAHGIRLLREVQSAFAVMESLDGRVQYVAMKGYLQIRERLLAQMHNWSRDGRIKLGTNMQSQARDVFDSDMAGGYAKWLAGAWIESQERNSLKAQQAFCLLEGAADYIRKNVE